MSTIDVIVTVLVVLFFALMVLFLIGSAKQNKAYDKKVNAELKLYRVGKVYATAYTQDQAIRLISMHYAREMGDSYTVSFVKSLGLYNPDADFKINPEFYPAAIYNYFLALKERSETRVFIA